MGRILAVDDDVLSRAVLVDALRSLGHEAVASSSGPDALARLLGETFDLVITKVVLPGMSGLDVARRVASRTPPIPVVLLGAPSAADLRGVPHAGVLAKAEPVALARVLDTAFDAVSASTTRPAAATGWSGAEALAAVSGPLDRFPPVRVLFLAHRVAATGALRVERDGKVALVGVRAGNVAHVAGVPGLFATLGPSLPDDLVAGLGAVIAAGHPPDRALAAAGEGLGAWLASLVDARGGAVSFDASWSPPPGSFPLPEPLPRLLARGLALGRPDALVARTWRALDAAGLSPRLPDDSAESRWGIDATSMRVLRLAPRARTVDALVREAAGTDVTRRIEVLRALDTLTILGLLVVDGGGVARATPERGGPPVEPTQEDPRARRLAEAAAAMENGRPLEILQLTDRRTLSEEDVANAYREISRRYHPDTYFNAPPAVRALAETCFSRVNAAYDALRAPDGMGEARRQLQAIASGVPFVANKDHLAARVAFRRAEVAWRAHDWRGADPLFQEAARLDPHAWPHALYAAYCGWLARRVPTSQALAALEAIKPKEPVRAAEVLVWTGNLLKQEGREADALVRYRAASQKDPTNRDAQREIRLYELRHPNRPPPAPSGGLFGGMFGSKKD